MSLYFSDDPGGQQLEAMNDMMEAGKENENLRKVLREAIERIENPHSVAYIRGLIEKYKLDIKP
jgi:hypothetical protein